MSEKTYYDYMAEIDSEELLEKLVKYGLFTEKLPPVFQSEDFYNSRINKEGEVKYDCTYKKKSTKPIIFESIRNNNLPRIFGIPNPFNYLNQCISLRDNWDKILEHFYLNSKEDIEKISQLHIKKQEGIGPLINYNPYISYREQIEELERMIEEREEELRQEIEDLKQKIKQEREKKKEDKNTSLRLKLLKKYIVRADISKFYSSIYTHSIPWALIGKEKAKKNRKSNEWYNEIDKKTRQMKSDETNGILIGPHSSNIISEIILVKIDNELSDKGWSFIRYSDDYTCYVDSEEEANKFLVELKEILNCYNLLLNHRKTKIIKIPEEKSTWVGKLLTYSPIYYKTKINSKNKEMGTEIYSVLTYSEVSEYLTYVMELSKENEDLAVINYAIKVLSKLKLTSAAKEYYIFNVLNLAHINTYLIHLLDEYVFGRFKEYFEDYKGKNNEDLMKKVCDKIYDEGIRKNDYEAVYYSLYYSLKYGFEIKNLKFEDIENTRNPIVYLFGYLVSKRYSSVNNNIDEYIRLAEKLSGIEDINDEVDINLDSFQENWLFIYEVLNREKLSKSWASIKKQGVSFLKKEYR